MVEANRQVPVAVAESDPDLRSLFSELVRQAGATARECPSLEEAEQCIAQRHALALLVDSESHPEGELESLIRMAQRITIPVGVLASGTNPEDLQRWLGLGPIRFIPLPSSHAGLFQEVCLLVGEARERTFLVDLRDTFVRDWNLSHRFLGHSPALNSMLRCLPRLAAEDEPLLILGEPATGRRRVGQIVHDLSRRAQHPCIVIDCGSVDDENLDEALFQRALATDDAGTLILGDVQELPIAMQARLIAWFTATPRSSPVRIVATAQPDLEQRVEDGRFREGLLSCIGPLRVRVPALRERPGDIPMLATSVLERLRTKDVTDARSFSPEALDLLVRSDWPGNLNELADVIECAARRSVNDVITPADLGQPVETEAGTFPELSLPFHRAKADVVQRFEREYAKRILAQHGGNVSAAARAAGLDRRSLTRLLDRQGVPRRR